MKKKVLIISSSYRTKGNSARLAEEFFKGAKEAGNDVEFVSLHDKTIGFCRGCLACQTTLRCVIRDDADIIREKMLNADVLVFATPVYYYGISGQLKTLLDRCNPLYSSDYKFREVYLLFTAAEDSEDAKQRTLDNFDGWLVCYENAQLAGYVFCGGVNDVGDIEGDKKLKEAYEMGKTV